MEDTLTRLEDIKQIGGHIKQIRGHMRQIGEHRQIGGQDKLEEKKEPKS